MGARLPLACCLLLSILVSVAGSINSTGHGGLTGSRLTRAHGPGHGVPDTVTITWDDRGDGYSFWGETCLREHLNTSDAKIWTCEDPVEITQKGLRQVQINRKAGIDFPLVMRAFLRADPDIIMVGESRDHETVAMGVEASLTGHLVFSTLHTNSAPEPITRLLDMGMDPFNFADALLGILAQRLAKKLCDCKEAYVPDADELRLFAKEYAEELSQTAAWIADPEGELDRLVASWKTQYARDGQIHFYRHVGCDKCKQTGYKGRVGLHELLIADDDIKRRIQLRARVAEISAAAVERGMRTLKMDGMEKVMMGLTDLKVVRSVCIR